MDLKTSTNQEHQFCVLFDRKDFNWKQVIGKKKS